MAPKRPLESSTPSETPSQPAAKKPKSGFRVPAPDNLPDGPWRRKAIKIKHELIDKAKVKKEYAKLKKAQEAQQQEAEASKQLGEVIKVDLPEPVLQQSSTDGETQPTGENKATDEVPEPPQLHPDRIAMLDADEPHVDPYDDVNGFNAARKKRDEARRAGTGDYTPRENTGERKQRHGPPKKPGYYEKELAEAERKKAEAQARQAERERQQKEREKAIKERERHRRIMAKARSGGMDGKRKLGKESIVLLDRVKRLVGN